MTGDDLPAVPPPTDREIEDRWDLEWHFRTGIDRIALSFFGGIEPDGAWSVELVSWTGLEWAGMPCLGQVAFVEAVDSLNPPHDHLFVFRHLDGSLHMLACYRRDGDLLRKISRLEDGEALGFPETVPWRVP